MFKCDKMSKPQHILNAFPHWQYTGRDCVTVHISYVEHFDNYSHMPFWDNCTAWPQNGKQGTWKHASLDKGLGRWISANAQCQARLSDFTRNLMLILFLHDIHVATWEFASRHRRWGHLARTPSHSLSSGRNKPLIKWGFIKKLLSHIRQVVL